jgi:spermidine synthase
MFLFVGIALVAGAGLAFQIALTRIFAIAQGYHFGFLAISLALLGFGASGTALALRPAFARGDVMRRLARWSLAFSLCLAASYLVINHLPFDAYRVAFERVQLAYLVLYYLALVTPFFVGGLVLGLPLIAFSARAARAYAANLAGSGLGCLAALGALAGFGEVGAVLFAAMLAALGAGAFACDVTRKTRLVSSAIALVVLWSALLIAPPRAFDVQLSPYRGLSQTLLLPDARIVFSATNAFSRVQVVESGAIRSAPGLSLTYRGELPVQRALFKDAESLSPLTDFAPAALLDALPVTLAYRLRPNARALILEPGGGLEVLAALHASAREIVVVEENPLVAHVARAYAPRAFADARVRVVAVGARSFLARTREKFDVVHLALSEPFRPVTAGAYALGENYLYTREAFREYLEHLNDDGILVMHRWLQLPPTEETRVAALAITALEDTMVGAPPPVTEHLLALRSFSTMLMLVKRTPFTAREIEMARAFAETQQFDWVAAPNLDARATNRYHFLPNNDYLVAFQPLFDRARRATFFNNYAYDITPPTDDRPFFFHFFKWEQTPQVLQLLGKTWQPFGGSGYLILLALFGLSVLVSVALILVPLIALRAQFSAHLARAPRELIYFAALGIGFLFIEIPLIQRFILFLDHPVYAFATVVFALLLASGVGSFVSARVPLRGALAALIVAVVIYPLFLPLVFQLTLGYPLEGRVLIALALLAPLGFLMGIPFPKGIARLNASAPNLVPLAWGVNGCASVLSSILSTMGALTFGFLVVMFVGAGMYAVAMGCGE